MTFHELVLVFIFASIQKEFKEEEKGVGSEKLRLFKKKKISRSYREGIIKPETGVDLVGARGLLV